MPIGDVSVEGIFTKNGQAIDMNLHNGGEIRFDVDDVVLVDSINATGYRRADQQDVLPFNQRFEVVERDRIYVRRLNNFPLMLEKLRFHTKEIDEATEVVKNDNLIAEATFADANTQLEERDRIIGGLRQDNANLMQDVEVIAELLENRRQEVEALRAKIIEVEAEIKRRRGQIQ